MSYMGYAILIWRNENRKKIWTVNLWHLNTHKNISESEIKFNISRLPRAANEKEVKSVQRRFEILQL